MGKAKKGRPTIDEEAKSFLTSLDILMELREAEDFQTTEYCQNLSAEILAESMLLFETSIGQLHMMLARVTQHHHIKTVDQGRKSAHNKKMNEIDEKLEELGTRISNVVKRVAKKGRKST